MASAPSPDLDGSRPWDCLQALHGLSSIERVRLCRCRNVPGQPVGIALHGTRAGYTMLRTCGSVWSCPICRGKILAQRGRDVQQVVERHHAAGGRIVLLTGTMRHHRGHRLDDLLGALNAAFRAATQNRAQKAALAKLGYSGYVRNVETTVGANGWHPHIHALLLVDAGATQEAVDEVREYCATSWASSNVRRGLQPPSGTHGVDMRLLDLTEAREAAAGYLTKVDDLEQVRPNESRNAALELTGAGKRGRGENRTAMQLLADVVDHGDLDDLALWHEYERATQNAKFLTWSQGLRKRYAIGDELTDEEAAQQADDEQVPVTTMTFVEWTALRSLPGRPAELLALVSAAASIDETPNIDALGVLVDDRLRAWGVRTEPPDVP